MTLEQKITLFILFFLILYLSIILFLYFTYNLSIENMISLLLGIVLTTLNAYLGFYSIKAGIDKPAKIFFRWILGGMVVRLFLLIVAVVLVFEFLEINRISFIFSILFFYIFYLIIEVIYLNFRSN